MNRRELLSVVAVGSVLASTGCVDEWQDSGSSDSTTIQSERRTIDLVRSDSPPADTGIDIQVEVIKNAIGPDSTAEIELSTVNTGSKRRISVGTGGCAIFNREDLGSDPPGIWLRTPSRSEPRNPEDGAWVADDLPSSNEGFGGYGCPKRAYDDNEVVTTKYEVWDDGRVDGYLEPGAYRWDVSIQVWNSSPDSDRPDDTFDWGFDLELIGLQST